MSGVSLHAPRPTAWRREVIARGGQAVFPALVAGVAVGGLAAGRGGYFPTSWGWAVVPLTWVAAMALCLRVAPRLGRLEILFLSGLTIFAAWIALSITWSREPAQTVLEVERALVYPAGVLAVLLVARGRAVGQVLGGV